LRRRASQSISPGFDPGGCALVLVAGALIALGLALVGGWIIPRAVELFL
jgi:hypothetical protein